jgi:putative membrane protein
MNGVKTFGGPSKAKLFYYPFLITHIVGSSVMGFLTMYQVYSGIKRYEKQEEKEWSKFKFEKEYRIRHRSWGKKAIILWWFSALSGLAVYIMLYILYSPEKVVIQ